MKREDVFEACKRGEVYWQKSGLGAKQGAFIGEYDAKVKVTAHVVALARAGRVAIPGRLNPDRRVHPTNGN